MNSKFLVRFLIHKGLHNSGTECDTDVKLGPYTKQTGHIWPVSKKSYIDLMNVIYDAVFLILWFDFGNFRMPDFWSIQYNSFYFKCYTNVNHLLFASSKSDMQMFSVYPKLYKTPSCIVSLGLLAVSFILVKSNGLERLYQF